MGVALLAIGAEFFRGCGVAVVAAILHRLDGGQQRGESADRGGFPRAAIPHGEKPPDHRVHGGEEEAQFQFILACNGGEGEGWAARGLGVGFRSHVGVTIGGEFGIGNAGEFNAVSPLPRRFAGEGARRAGEGRHENSLPAQHFTTKIVTKEKNA